MDRHTISLTRRQMSLRLYGIWWDMINTGGAILVLTGLFLAMSFVFISGRLDLLPYSETVFRQMIEYVSEEKQSEIGISLLGITLSASSAAVLYLIRLGTARWANNRRLGFIFSFFAEMILLRMLDGKDEKSSLRNAVQAFLGASDKMFDQVSELHPRAQMFFEHARMKSHLFLQDGEDDFDTALDISRELYGAALVCQKIAEFPDAAQEYEQSIKQYIIECF